MNEQRHTVDTITSDQLDALQDERDRLRAELDRKYRAHDSRDALQYALSGLTPEGRAISRVRAALRPLNEAFTDGRLHLTPAMQALWVRLEDALDEPKEPTP